MTDIFIKLEGDAASLVAACKQALDAEMQLTTVTDTINNKLKTQAELQNQASEAAQKHGQSTKNLHQEVGGLEGMLNKGAGTVKAFIGAWVGIEGIQKAWAYVSEEIKKAIELQRKFGEAGLTAEEKLQKLIIARGEQGDKGAQARTQAEVNETKRALGIKDTGAAVELLTAGHEIFREQMKLSPEMTKQMTMELGKEQQMKGYDAGTTEKIAQLAPIMGADTPAKMRQMMEKLSSTFDVHQMPAVMQNLAPMMIQGKAMNATPDQTIAMLKQSMEVYGKGQEGEAIGSTEMLMRTLSGTQAEKIAKKMHIKKKDWADLEPEARLSALGEYMQTAKPQEVEELFPGRVGLKIRPLLGAEGAAGRRATQEQLQGATGEGLTGEWAAYQGTDIYKHRTILAQAEIAKEMATQNLTMGTAQQVLSQEEANRARAGLPVEGMDKQIQEGLKSDLWIPLLSEPGLALEAKTRKQKQLLMTKGIAEKDIAEYSEPEMGGRSTIIPLTPRGEKLSELSRLQEGLGGVFDKAENAGKVVRLLEELTAEVRAGNRNTGKMAINSGTVVSPTSGGN